jgi:hypothetical protein
MAEFMPLKGGHGSCMLSKIAGATLGVAKKITPIITVINSQAYIDENFLDGLQMIYDHVIANGNQGISTVSMSINVKSQDITQGWIARFGMYFSR